MRATQVSNSSRSVVASDKSQFSTSQVTVKKLRRKKKSKGRAQVTVRLAEKAPQQFLCSLVHVKINNLAQQNIIQWRIIIIQI